eukprot:TRINITY_DN47045_c0_g1_i1.p1 TRINITY_DN47045_c0_g1~~TRINITY_DN47045_c0_g1_i1.p1  ORF type:complete len:190 (+),score=19.00 TRINITY_DN47045_c0_g1_i1:38-607(+)
MACGSGSALAGVRALRNQSAPQQDAQPPFSATDTNPVQTEEASLVSNKKYACAIATIVSNAECLLEAHSLAFNSESGVSDDGSDCTPRRTTARLSIQDPDEFANFVEGCLAREMQLDEETSTLESLMRKLSDANNFSDQEVVRSEISNRFPCANRDKGSDCASVSLSHVHRSPRMDSFQMPTSIFPREH